MRPVRTLWADGRVFRGKGDRSGRALKTAATDPGARYNWKQGETNIFILYLALGIWFRALGI